MKAKKLPGTLRCLLAIAGADLLLRALGVGRTLVWAHRAGRSPDDVLVIDADEIARRVAVAGALYPGRALCLEQSLALYVLLRRRGVPADLRFGVRPYPFLAHAWVEVAGVPLNEQPENIERLAPFTAYGA
jgi:hypothetical protein